LRRIRGGGTVFACTSGGRPNPPKLIAMIVQPWHVAIPVPSGGRRFLPREFKASSLPRGGVPRDVPTVFRRHEPEKTVLHHVVRKYLDTFPEPPPFPLPGCSAAIMLPPGTPAEGLRWAVEVPVRGSLYGVISTPAPSVPSRIHHLSEIE
jgi:hypothetical protein